MRLQLGYGLAGAGGAIGGSEVSLPIYPRSSGVPAGLHAKLKCLVLFMQERYRKDSSRLWEPVPLCCSRCRKPLGLNESGILASVICAECAATEEAKE